MYTQSIFSLLFLFITESDDGDTPPVGDGLWMRILGDDAGPTDIPFTGVPGPTHPPQTPEPVPADYARLFIKDDLIDLLVAQTNLYARQWIQQHQAYLNDRPFSRVHQWIKQGYTTREEMYAFLSVCINMGLIKKPTIESYWNTTNTSQSTPWFPEHFNRDRFSLIM